MRRYLALALALLILVPVAAESTGTLSIPVVFGSLTAGTQSLSLFDTAFNAIRDYINAREITQASCASRPTAGVAGRWYFCTDTSALYADTGSAWVQVSSTSVYTDQLTGLTTSNEPTATGTSINVAVGSAASEDTLVGDRVLMTLASATTGNTSSTWLPGNYASKLDTGALAANTTYFTWLIQRPDTLVTDILFSLSATSPTMPTNYTKRRRIGAFTTDNGGIIKQFIQSGDKFLVKKTTMTIAVTNPGGGAVTTSANSATAVFIPVGFPVDAILNVRLECGSNAFGAFFSSPAQDDDVPAVSAGPLFSIECGVTKTSGELTVRTDSSAQIRFRLNASGAADILRVAPMGWYDRRGVNCNRPC